MNKLALITIAALISSPTLAETVPALVTDSVPVYDIVNSAVLKTVCVKEEMPILDGNGGFLGYIVNEECHENVRYEPTVQLTGFDVYWVYENWNGVEFTQELYEPGDSIPAYVGEAD